MLQILFVGSWGMVVGGSWRSQGEPEVELKGPGMREWCWFIFVYISTDRSERVSQWDFLERTKANWGRCWVIAGDWNDIISNDEKRGGVRRLEASFRGFKTFIQNMGMQECDQKGSFFTWGNNREGDGYVEERLDKVFTSYDWLVEFPKMKVINFYRTASDHNVLLFATEMEAGRGKKRFSFDKSWAMMEGVQEAIKAGWQVDVEGSYMYQVHQKIKHTRMALLAWHKSVHRNSEKAVKVLTEKLEDLRRTGYERDWDEWGRRELLEAKIEGPVA
ncbi:RNA-directed DNA polymerase-like protein [Striga asiatica]|uniref:RNA-directed DNA polymerase-like protein n=1 Tax=Striga asiatica TaxID=4170 RepID=A0A5A7P7K7_STRAF|nr:RNA-directed DNA polymerase-like protein [Striga asiatica]